MGFLWMCLWASSSESKTIYICIHTYTHISIYIYIKYDSIGVFYEFIKLVCRCLLSLYYFGFGIPATQKHGKLKLWSYFSAEYFIAVLTASTLVNMNIPGRDIGEDNILKLQAVTWLEIRVSVLSQGPLKGRGHIKTLLNATTHKNKTQAEYATSSSSCSMLSFSGGLQQFTSRCNKFHYNRNKKTCLNV